MLQHLSNAQIACIQVVPLFGGVLVPDLLFLTAFSSGPTGDFELSGPWPPGIPPGITVYFQMWFVDPGIF